MTDPTTAEGRWRLNLCLEALSKGQESDTARAWLASARAALAHINTLTAERDAQAKRIAELEGEASVLNADLGDLDDVVRVLGLESSEKTPTEAVEVLLARIAELERAFDPAVSEEARGLVDQGRAEAGRAIVDQLRRQGDRHSADIVEQILARPK